MSNKKILILGTILLTLLISLQLASALSATGWAPRVIRPEKGVPLEKYILVQNTNDVPITIEIEVGGDLKDDIELVDNTFVLLQGQEKKAYFTVNTQHSGLVNFVVRYVPEEGNAVGLSHKVSVSTEGGTPLEKAISEDNDEPTDTTSDSPPSNDEPSGFSLTPGGIPEESRDKPFNPMIIFSITTPLLAIAVIALLIFSAKLTKPKKRLKRRA
jgi:hypothetical protein